MNDAIALVITNGRNNRRQIHHIAADQGHLCGIDTAGVEQSFVERDVEYHRPFPPPQQHRNRISANQAGPAGYKNSLLSHNSFPPLQRRASTISNGMLSQRSAELARNREWKIEDRYLLSSIIDPQLHELRRTVS